MQVLIDIQDRATPAIQQLVARLSPPQLAAATGPKLRQTVRDHIKRLPKNKKGWPSTGFWEDAARGTTWESNPDGTVTISINKLGFRQRYYGGVISAVKRDYLTIPISPQAYGKTASEFPGAFLLRTKKGAYLVQYGGSVSKTGRGINKHNASIEFLFKLQSSVEQEPMPWIIPDATALHAVAFAAIEERFRTTKAGGAN